MNIIITFPSTLKSVTFENKTSQLCSLAGPDNFRSEETVLVTTVVPRRISTGIRAEPISGFGTIAVVSCTPNTVPLAAYWFTVDTQFFLGCSGGKDNARHGQVMSRLVGLDR